MLHHHLKKLDNYLRTRANHNLALTTAFSIDHAVQTIVENVNADHFCDK